MARLKIARIFLVAISAIVMAAKAAVTFIEQIIKLIPEPAIDTG